MDSMIGSGGFRDWKMRVRAYVGNLVLIGIVVFAVAGIFLAPTPAGASLIERTLTSGWTGAETAWLSDETSIVAAPQVAADGQGNVIVVWYELGNGGSEGIRVASKSFDGPFSYFDQLSGPGAFDPKIEMNRAGDAVIAWQTNLGGERIQASVRGADGTFGQVETLSTSNSRNHDVAMDGEGNATVVWENSSEGKDRIQAAELPAGGSFSNPETVSSPGLSSLDPQVAMNEAGESVIAWSSFKDAVWKAGDPPFRQEIIATVQNFANELAEPLKLSGDALINENPQVTIDNRGIATVTWTGGSGGARRVNVSQFRPGLGDRLPSFSEPQILSGVDAFQPRITSDRAGNVAVVWQQAGGDFNDEYSVFGSVKPLDGRFGEAQVLSGGNEAFDPVLQVDGWGNAVVLWSEYDSLNDRFQVMATSIRADDGNFLVPTLVSSGRDQVSVPAIVVEKVAGSVPSLARQTPDSGTANANAVWKRSRIQSASFSIRGNLGPGFAIKLVESHPRRGTATLTIKTQTGGQVTIGGSHKLAFKSSRLRKAGVVRLLVQPKRGMREILKRHHSAFRYVRVRFHRSDGATLLRTKRVKLRLR